MAAYYFVRDDDRRPLREVGLGFPTYKKLFAVARRFGSVLIVRCEDFHGMDEFQPHEFEALRREIAAARAAASSMPDVVEFLDGLYELVQYASSRGAAVIADAD